MERKSSNLRRLEATFRRRWATLASNGVCDEIDGLEFLRVRAEWFYRGCPLPVRVFIRTAANRPASQTQRSN